LDDKFRIIFQFIHIDINQQDLLRSSLSPVVLGAISHASDIHVSLRILYEVMK